MAGCYSAMHFPRCAVAMRGEGWQFFHHEMTGEMVTNLAAYRFVELSGLKGLREELLALCKEAGLKGTILLSVEGINLFVAGSAEGISRLMSRLREIPGLGDFEGKVS